MIDMSTLYCSSVIVWRQGFGRSCQLFALGVGAREVCKVPKVLYLLTCLHQPRSCIVSVPTFGVGEQDETDRTLGFCGTGLSSLLPLRCPH